jgi:hypothetical protein
MTNHGTGVFDRKRISPKMTFLFLKFLKNSKFFYNFFLVGKFCRFWANRHSMKWGFDQRLRVNGTKYNFFVGVEICIRVEVIWQIVGESREPEFGIFNFSNFVIFRNLAVFYRRFSQFLGLYNFSCTLLRTSRALF